MTRITSLGRKRTHHDAQFNDIFEENREKSPNAELDEPHKKKRKEEGLAELSSNVGNLNGNESRPKTGWGRSEAVKAKAAGSEQRRQKRIQERQSGIICFACRQQGHTARDCPSNTGGGHGKAGMGICYRCGSSKHTLSKCRKSVNEANPLPYASCFICKGKGHLASTCSQNPNGVYPNGGSCKLCSKTDHLARNCPLRTQTAPAEGILFNAIGGDAPGADEDDFMSFRRKTTALTRDEQTRQKLKAPIKASDSLPRRKVVTF